MDWLSISVGMLYALLLVVFGLFAGYSAYRVIANREQGDRVTGIVSIILMVLLIYIMTKIF